MDLKNSLGNESARVAVPGTCGELVQGTLDGIPCLVSCPIEHYSVAEVCFESRSGWLVQPATSKVRAALQVGLTYLGRTKSSGRLRLSSRLPRGRGYGSSTADVGAALYALGQAVGCALAPADVARLVVQIEPSDSSLFSGLVLWDHLHGTRYESLGQPPAFSVVVLDPGGKVDTVAYNRLDHRTALRKLEPQHQQAFTLLREGLKHGDPQAIGVAATMSATAHQAILPNPLLEPSLNLAHEVGAVGVCRAHSGTLLGLLLDPSRTEAASVVAWARRRLAQAIRVFSLPVVSGGPRILTGGEVSNPLSLASVSGPS